MPTGIKEVLLIVIGFVLGLVPSWLDRKRRLRAHLLAIRAEMQLARARASMLLSDNIMAPLYRLPVSAYQTSFPVLVAEGLLSENDALSLGDYFCQVEDINRGLENATAMAHANDAGGIRREYERLLLKGRRLIEDGNERVPLFGAALAVIEKQLSRPWWQY